MDRVRTLQTTTSVRLNHILSSSDLRQKFEALLLLKYDKIGELFELSPSELNEYKEKFFNVNYLLSMGRPYIVDYLEREGQSLLLDYYLRGVDYALAKMGYSSNLTDESKMDLQDKLIGDILLFGLKANIPVDQKIRCLKGLEGKIGRKEEVDLVDKIVEMFKDVNI